MNFKKIKIIFLILSFLFIPFNFIFAYNTETHAYLTKEIIDFYNSNFKTASISKNFEDDLINGSRHEDIFPRWMNHFYDPVYDRGLSSIILGNWEKSKDWAENENSQNNIIYKVSYLPGYLLGIFGKKEEQDYSVFTWQKAIDYWLEGRKGEALFVLGHILHLIEDSSVPDHTRNDAHPNDSPYENWTKKYILKNPDIGLKQRLQGKNPISFPNLAEYFNSLAKYANNNFYSKDTIGITGGYKLPDVDYFSVESGVNYGVKTDFEFGDYHLIKTPQKALGVSFDNEDFLKDNFVLNDYWSRLSTKAVQHGAGVVNLFFQEIRRIEASNIESKNSFFANIYEALKNQISAIIEILKDSNNDVSDSVLSIEKIIEEMRKQSVASEDDVEDLEGVVQDFGVAVNKPMILNREVQEKLQKILANLNDLVDELKSFSSVNNSGNQDHPAAPTLVFGGGSPPVQVSENQENSEQNQNTPNDSNSSSSSSSAQSEIAETVTSTSSAENSSSISAEASSTPVVYPNLNFSAIFNSSTKDIFFSWNSLIDASSSTIFIVYEIYDISSSSEMIFETSSTTEFKKEINEFGRDYSFLLSVVDGGNNEVASSSATVSVPEIILEPILTTSTTRFYIVQTEQNSWSNIIGRVAINSFDPDSASFQSFIFQEDFSFNKVVLRFQCGEGCGDTANVRLVVYKDSGNNAPDFSNLLGVAFHYFDWNDIHPAPDQDISFLFAAPIRAEKENRYWFLLDVANYSDARAYFRERGSDWRNALMKGVDVYEWGGRALVPGRAWVLVLLVLADFILTVRLTGI
ncbi:MAG: hypothetical protein QMD50_00365 [Patescibacteria group bacterium]|nr:hypothetical protein [Patescibacteria group bacterium]